MAGEKGTSRETSAGMTVGDAGRKGGETTASTHGREFYQEIGKKGGDAVSREVQAGKEATSRRHSNR